MVEHHLLLKIYLILIYPYHFYTQQQWATRGLTSWLSLTEFREGLLERSSADLRREDSSWGLSSRWHQPENFSNNIMLISLVRASSPDWSTICSQVQLSLWFGRENLLLLPVARCWVRLIPWTLLQAPSEETSALMLGETSAMDLTQLRVRTKKSHFGSLRRKWMNGNLLATNGFTNDL